MAASVKEYLLEMGVRKEVALDIDEIALVIHNRLVRLKQTGIEKSQLLTDIGKYRHIDQKNPQSLPELMRVCQDLALLSLKFTDRLRLAEHYDIILLNVQTGCYELTNFGMQFYGQRAEVV